MTGTKPTGDAVPLPAALAREPTAGVVAREEPIAAIVDRTGPAAERAIVVVAGEAGIGKTTVAAEAARRFHARGSVVLHGRCHEDLRVPYLPLVEALEALISHAPDTVVERLDPTTLVEISRLVDAVRTRRPDLPRPASTDADTERYRLFRAVTDLLGQLGRAGAPAVMVVEDLHWADESTTLLLRHMATGLNARTAVVVATGRDGDPLAGDAIPPELADLIASGVIDRVDLQGLAEHQMVDLLEHLAGHALDSDGVDLARQLRAGTGGNPFFATSILQHLAETGTIAPLAGRWSATVAIDQISLPDSVRDVLGRRLRTVAPEVREALEMASILGPEFSLRALSALLGNDEEAVLDHLEAACEAGLVDEDARRIGWFTFGHALIRQALYESQSRTRRSIRHRQVAELLESGLPVPDRDSSGELAHHWSMVGSEEGFRRAGVHALEAGWRALDGLAPADALRWFERAIELAAGQGTPHDGGHLLDARIGLGEAQRQIGDPSFRATLITAALEADMVGDLPRMVRAVLANHRGLVSVVGEVDEERISLIERAIAAVGGRDSPERARLLALLAAEVTFCRDHRRVHAAAIEAEEVARRIGDPETLLHVLNFVFLPMWVPSELDRTLRVTEEARLLAEEVGDPVQLFFAIMNRLYAMISSLDRPAMDQMLDAAQAVATEVGQPFVVWRVRFAACVPPLLDGDVERAEELAEAALDIGVQSGQADSFALYGATLTQIRLHQGRIDEVVPLVAELARENPGLPAFGAAHAMMLAESGQSNEARALIDEAMARDFDHTAYDYVWSTTATLWADAAATVGHAEAARILYEQLRPFAHQGIASGPTMSGTTTHYLARLASALGAFDEAEAHFAAADRELAAVGGSYFYARNKLLWAETLRIRDPDSVDARLLTEEARTIAERHGCAGILERVVTPPHSV